MNDWSESILGICNIPTQWADTSEPSFSADSCWFSRVLLMEEPWARLLVCPGTLQRPQRVWQAAGDHADPDTGQLHGGHQLWVLVWRPTLQWEEADSLRGLYADERTVFQLTASLTDCTVWHHWLTDWLTDWLDWLFQVPTKRSKHSGMIQAQQDTAHMEHMWHIACVVGPENKHSVRKKKIFTVALLVHVLMVKLLPLLQVILQNNSVTFDLIWSDRHCEISMLFYQPVKFAASFCGFGESYLNMCLSIFQHVQ